MIAGTACEAPFRNGSPHDVYDIHHIVYRPEDVLLTQPYVELSLCDVLDSPHYPPSVQFRPPQWDEFCSCVHMIAPF